ncbi:hypothetical protein EAKF1_ch3465c [Escherichia albertii KF1]|nr:hypothetical protein EAKF1_ch3465c [Escherichia albertii KF1]
MTQAGDIHSPALAFQALFRNTSSPLYFLSPLSHHLSPING